MSFLDKIEWTWKTIAKLIGLVILGIVAFTIVIALISFSFRTIFQGPSYRGGYEEASFSKGFGAPQAVFSEPAFLDRAILPPTPGGGFSTGDTAEDFEVKNYSATVETRKLEKTCEKIQALKARDDVIFESADQGERNCFFRFKVKKENAEEIVEIVKDLDPRDFNENIQTIKGSLDYYDNQSEILEKKLASVEETLTNAQEAYDDITELATRKQDVESLATIIDSKLNLIEKLTSQRIQIKEQIDRLEQNKADQLDRLKFTFFNVSIIEDLIFDWEQIKESWKFELKSLVNNFNDVIQGLSVSLITFIIRFAQAALYFFLSVFLLKFVWIATKRIWTGKFPKRRK